MQSFSFRIAEIVFSVKTEAPLPGLGENYEEFLSEGGVAEVSLCLNPGGIPELSTDRLRPQFRLGAWRLGFSDGRWVLSLPSDGSETGALAVFEEDFSTGDIYYQPSEPEAGSLVQVLSHPIHQILMVSILSRGRGALFHGAGIDDRGDGYLFLGRSSDGKSTLANVWREGRILDDDRIIVREKDGSFWMYGTPWHSIPEQASPAGLPVRRVFILRKGKKNLALRKARIEALSMMLQRCFLPFWDKDGAEYVVDFCGRLATEVPCHELTFVPDATVTDYVRELLG